MGRLLRGRGLQLSGPISLPPPVRGLCRGLSPASRLVAEVALRPLTEPQAVVTLATPRIQEEGNTLREYSGGKAPLLGEDSLTAYRKSLSCGWPRLRKLFTRPIDQE